MRGYIGGASWVSVNGQVRVTSAALGWNPGAAGLIGFSPVWPSLILLGLETGGALLYCIATQ